LASASDEHERHGHGGELIVEFFLLFLDFVGWVVTEFLRLIFAIVRPCLIFVIVRLWRLLSPNFRARVKARYDRASWYFDAASGIAALLAGGSLAIVACVWLVTAVTSPEIQPPPPQLPPPQHRNFGEFLQKLLPQHPHTEP